MPQLLGLMLHCETSTMVINDLMGGVGEVGVATLRAKVSPEASERRKRVCYYGSEDRKVFGEIGKANVATAIGQAYLDGKLSIPGLVPIPAPAGGPASGGISSEAILAALGHKPLCQLQIDGEGHLLIPTAEEFKNNPPCGVDKRIVKLLGCPTCRVSTPRGPSPRAVSQAQSDPESGAAP